MPNLPTNQCSGRHEPIFVVRVPAPSQKVNISSSQPSAIAVRMTLAD